MARSFPGQCFTPACSPTPPRTCRGRGRPACCASPGSPREREGRSAPPAGGTPRQRLFPRPRRGGPWVHASRRLEPSRRFAPAWLLRLECSLPKSSPAAHVQVAPVGEAQLRAGEGRAAPRESVHPGFAPCGPVLRSSSAAARVVLAGPSCRPRSATLSAAWTGRRLDLELLPRLEDRGRFETPVTDRRRPIRNSGRTGRRGGDDDSVRR